MRGPVTGANVLVAASCKLAVDKFGGTATGLRTGTGPLACEDEVDSEGAREDTAVNEEGACAVAEALCTC